VVEKEYEGMLLEVRDKLEENTEGERDFTAAKDGQETIAIELIEKTKNGIDGISLGTFHIHKI
jgi:hypothetical protein